MRDIRPDKPNRHSRKKGLTDDFDRAEMEVYEAASAHAKRKRPSQSTEPMVTRRSLNKEQVLGGQKSAKNVPKKPSFTGPTVPVTRVNVPEPQKTTLPAKRLSEKRSWRKRLFERALKSRTEPLQRSPLSEERVSAKHVRVGGRERRIILGFFGLVVVALLGAAVIFLPTATITLTLKTAPLLVDETITIHASGEGVEGGVPGVSFFREVPVQGSIPVESTEIVGSNAHGQVKIVNATSEEQPIKERSRLVTSDGRLFYMLKHAIVPPDSSAVVEVEAAAAGVEGNVSNEKLTFAALDDSAASVLYAEVGEEGITGGAGETISVVAQLDLDAARQAAQDAAQAQAEGEIRAELLPGWTILEESWMREVVSFETTAEVGAKVPTIEYQGRVIVRVIGHEKGALEKTLREALEAQLDDDFMLFPGEISYTTSVKEVNQDETRVLVAARITHSTIPQLSIPSLRTKLAGRSLTEAQHYLEGLPGVRQATLETWPFWVQSIPRIEKRIDLNFESERQP